MAEYIEEPHISSTLRWDDVTLPPSVTVDGLDEVIFSKLDPNWRKTARIVGDVAVAYKRGSMLLDAGIIGARIQALAETGRIDSQGNLSMWRHSEVRLKAPA